MKEFFKVLDIEQVLDLIPGFARVQAEEIGLAQATGRVLAEDITADEDLPGFTRSIVDGYAVRAASTFGASEGGPALLQVVGSIAMGTRPDLSLAAGQAARIPTGGMLPGGADSVIMLEHADVLDESTIEAFRSVAPGQNVVAADEDFRKGESIAGCGRRLRPQDTGVLAAFGHMRIRVFRRPVVGIISTGDEIVPADSRPGPGCVRDVNSYTLAGLVAESGGVPVALGIIPDEFPALQAACRETLGRCDMVLISGGSSVGARDLSVEVIRAFEGSEILTHGIAISPGKPTILSRIDGKALWGLPGHVVSSMIVFARIVRPFLRHIGGLAEPRGEDIRISARLARNVASVMGRTDFVRVKLLPLAEGFRAEPVLGKSALIHTMIKADGIVEIGKNVEGLEEGARVEVIIF